MFIIILLCYISDCHSFNIFPNFSLYVVKFSGGAIFGESSFCHTGLPNMILLAQNIYWYKNHYSRQVNKHISKCILVQQQCCHFDFFFWIFLKNLLNIFGHSVTVCLDVPKLMSKRKTPVNLYCLSKQKMQQPTQLYLL